MRLTVLNSGSDGNGYLLECNDEILILECGVPLMDAKIALNFDLSKIVGCYCSHKHSDHAKYRKDYELLGVEFVAPYDSDKNRVNAKCGGFDLQAFRLKHGDVSSWGVLIRHSTGQTALFMTDAEYCPYLFKACNVNHFIVECNWQTQYINRDEANFQHKVEGHASLDTCKRFLMANKTASMRNVLLIHLGKGSTNPKECVAEVQSALGDDIYVDFARPKTIYEMR